MLSLMLYYIFIRLYKKTQTHIQHATKFDIHMRMRNFTKIIRTMNIAMNFMRSQIRFQGHTYIHM